MGEGNVALMALPPLRGHEGLLPLHRFARPRCLFGPPDPLYLKDAISQISEDNKKRWNFDFEKELPLKGRYKWEPVEHNINEGNSKSENESEVKDISKISPEKTVEVAPKIIQTHITDFMTRKRKSSKMRAAPPLKVSRRSST